NTCENDWDWYGVTQPTIESDNTGPKSPGSVGRVTFAAGFNGGSGQGQVCKFLNHTKFYMSAWIQLSSNFEGHPTGANKIFYIAMNNNTTFIVPEADGAGSNPLFARFVIQNLAANYQDQTGSFATTIGRTANLAQGVQISRGNWTRYEYVFTMNTPGNADGAIEMWQDGVKTFDLQGFTFLPAGASSTKFESVCWQPIWGGQGGTVVNTFYMQMDHIYISGK
ncbi:MAG TPA: hypothetical protein VE967_11820, partial [Gemmatimonadaceae bacterium]|nr:hypothetical protein [Gemmatimonadaceae bacterium]